MLLPGAMIPGLGGRATARQVDLLLHDILTSHDRRPTKIRDPLRISLSDLRLLLDIVKDSLIAAHHLIRLAAPVLADIGPVSAVFGLQHLSAFVAVRNRDALEREIEQTGPLRIHVRHALHDVIGEREILAVLRLTVEPYD